MISGRGKKIILYGAILLGIVILLNCYIVKLTFAQEVNQGLVNFVNITEMPQAPLITIISRVIRIFLGFLGLIAVVIIIWGGITWMTSRGEAEKVERAKKILMSGVIGLALIVFSYAIASFIIGRLLKVAGPPADMEGQACSPPGICSGCYRCGSDEKYHWDPDYCCPAAGKKFIITDIKPSPGDTTTVQNTVIRIYFNRPVKADTVTSASVLVRKTAEECENKVCAVPIDPPVDVSGTFEVTEKVVKFTPDASCPSPNEDRKCFDELSKFYVEAKTGQVRSIDENLGLDCTNNKCDRTFYTSDIVDTQSPDVEIIEFDPSLQGSYIAQRDSVVVTARATDDSGIAEVRFYVDEEATPRAILTEPDVAGGDEYSFGWDTSGYDIGSSHKVKAQVFDLDENEDSHTKNVKIRAEHCFNGIKDQDEEGTDCGGADCGACDGASCDSDAGTPECEPDDNLCASGYCDTVTCRCRPPRGPEEDCTLAEGGCGPNTLCTPYVCVDTNADDVCHCCCNTDSQCQVTNPDLFCDTTQDCSSETGPTVGICCGCTDAPDCRSNEVCDADTDCCKTCEGQADRTSCNGGECCNGVCCHGYCIEGQCITTCGNENVEASEPCDPSVDAGPSEILNGKSCTDFGFISGMLVCNPDCTFDTSNCRLAEEGDIGELCINNTYPACNIGREACSEPDTYSCLPDEAGEDCRCCCAPGGECPEPLECTADQVPCTGDTRGLCCGCVNDEQCQELDMGKICDPDNDCCYPFPAPTGLNIVEKTHQQIKLAWLYDKDYFKYVDKFEIWRAGPFEEGQIPEEEDWAKIDDASPNICTYNEDIDPDNYICLYIDSGAFEIEKFYFYKVQARHGVGTAVSGFSDSVEAEIIAVVGCTHNYISPCPVGENCCREDSPCCRKDTALCVTWEYCQGQCDVDDWCHPPEIKFAEADFDVTPDVPLGACLFKADPNKRERGQETTLTGLRFGTPGKVQFEKDGGGPIDFNTVSWTPEEIAAKVVDTSPVGEGSIWAKPAELGKSNSLWFKVTETAVGPGKECYESACPLNIGSCSPEPPYHCLVEGADCRCCCSPGAGECLNPLKCLPDISPCIGLSRGLCCGCVNDEQCGAGLGCGMLDPNRCCYGRPTVSFSTCAAPSGNIGRNTAIAMIFSDLMDHGSLRKNIELYKGDIEILGKIASVDNANQTIAIFYPSNCRLEPGTEYKVKVIGGKDGSGARSKLGVSMDDDEWTFTIGGEDDFCYLDSIEVLPTSAEIYTPGGTKEFRGLAFAPAGGYICVTGFVWSSDYTGVATVEPDPMDARKAQATAVKEGKAKIWAMIGLIGDYADLKVMFTGFEVDDDSTCRPEEEPPRLPSPNPRPNTGGICTNIQIAARFNMKVDNSTVYPNIAVERCIVEGEDPCVTGFEPVLGEIEIFAEDTKEGFVFTPGTAASPVSLVKNTVHRVTVSGGLEGVRSEPPDGLRMLENYVWQFKTKNVVTPCPAEYVWIAPSEAWIGSLTSPNNTQDYTAFVVGPNCQFLTGNFTWDWSSVDENVATVAGIDNIATATAQDWGETDIKATATLGGSKTGSSHLIVAPEPKVEVYWPLNNATNVCPNGLIWAQFDQGMDKASINNSTVGLYRNNAAEPCQAGWLYRKPIDIQNPNDFAVTNYQLSVAIGYEAGMNNDFSDLRFKEDGASIPYWIKEKTNGVSANVWLKIPSIPVKITPDTGQAEKTIYVYYGNKHALSESNFDAVFTKDFEDEGLIGLWHMDMGSGNIVYDASGFENNGLFPSEIESPTWQAEDGGHWDGKKDVKFIAGSALGFDGGDWLKIPYSSSLNLSEEITMELWFKTSEVQTGKFLLAKISGTSYDYGLYLTSNSTILQTYITNSAGTVRTSSKTGTFYDNQWHHFVGTFDGRYIKIYIDGIEGTPYDWGSGQTIRTGERPVYIVPGEGAGWSGYKGLIDEVRIYKRALPGDEILAHYERRKYAVSPLTAILCLNCEEYIGQGFKEGTTWWCPVSASVSTLDRDFDHDDKIETKVNIKPSGLLDFSKQHQVIIKGGPDGVKSKYKVPMAANKAWKFTTLDKICAIDHVSIDPPSHVFHEVDEEQEFIAQAYADAAETKALSAVYSWNKDDANLLKIVNIPTCEDESCTLKAKNEIGRARLEVEADSYGDKAQASAPIEVFLCKSLWEYEDAGPPYYNDPSITHFSLRYCRDRGDPDDLADDLPDFDRRFVVEADKCLHCYCPTPPCPVSPSCEEKLSKASCEGLSGQCRWGPKDMCKLKDFLFSQTGGTDLIGLRVFTNPKHLTPEDWFKEKFPGQSISKYQNIDGYPAARSGRTIYVLAPNVIDLSDALPSDQNIYTNIYLISYNEGASSETLEIYNQLVRNWQFNINVSSENKSKIARDLQRIIDFDKITKALEAYYEINGYYPVLKAGTYIKYESTSKWPSWQDTLARELGMVLPVDPLNEFATKDCPDPNDGTYQCCASCPKDNPQCDETCFNPDTGEFEWPEGSHIYVYRASPNGSGATLYVNFEYKPEGAAIVTWKSEPIVIDKFDTEVTHNYFKNFGTGAGGICGDSIVDPPEECELLITPFEECEGWACVPKCAPTKCRKRNCIDCHWGAWSSCGICPLFKGPGPGCGNGIREGFEICDGADGTPDNATCNDTCTGWTCDPGYRQYFNGEVTICELDHCVGPTEQSCSITNGTGKQTRTCNTTAHPPSWSDWGTCTVISCNSGYRIYGNTCELDHCVGANEQTCSITNGTGKQTRTCNTTTHPPSWGAWGTCTVVSCNSGYVQSGNQCISTAFTGTATLYLLHDDGIQCFINNKSVVDVLNQGWPWGWERTVNISSYLKIGENTIACQVQNCNPGSGDGGFDAKIVADGDIVIPYGKGGVCATNPIWKYHKNPSGNWWESNYDDTLWSEARGHFDGYGSGCTLNILKACPSKAYFRKKFNVGFIALP